MRGRDGVWTERELAGGRGLVAGEFGRGEVSASIFVFVSNCVASCSFGSGGGDGGRLMSAGCIIAVASMLAAEDE